MNWLAIILGAVGAFAVGAVWYGPLFGRAWQKEVGLSDEDLKNSNLAMTYGLSFLMFIPLSITLSFIIGAHPTIDWTHAAFHGALMGVMVLSAITGIHYLYQKKSLKLFLIDAGYAILFMAVCGAIQGAFV